METRVCQNCKNDFTIEPEDFLFYEKIKVPPPTWCAYCRFIRKMTFVNERSLYKRQCGNCGTSIITMYKDTNLFPVWCVKCYLADSWDPVAYGIDLDFSKNFFTQFKELRDTVPHRSLDQNEKNGSDTEYSNFCYSSKNSYLSFNVTSSENIKYSKYVLKKNKNCIDSFIFADNDKCYELVQASKNYNCSFLLESRESIDSHFLYDCSNCVSCCLSSNIRNKSFVFANQQLSKEDYMNAIKGLELGTYTGQVRAKNIFKEIVEGSIHKYAHNKNAVNVTGDFIENSKNIKYSYGVVGGENMKNIFFSMNVAKDSHDLIFTGRGEECYELAYGGRGINRVFFSFSCGSGSKNLFYCDNCKACMDCFGCVGLRNKQYCIFNKEYTKEEYFKITDKLKKVMTDMPYVDKIGRVYGFGEYFPTEISPFAYNETVAFEELPLSEEGVIKNGFTWQKAEAKSHMPTISVDDILNNIADIDDSICNEIISCPNNGSPKTSCSGAYKILKDELTFYKQMHLPIPRYCPNCRYHHRLVWKNPFRFYKRQCMCEKENHGHEGSCPNKFETSYSPERPEVVYCEKCYQKEVI